MGNVSVKVKNPVSLKRIVFSVIGLMFHLLIVALNTTEYIIPSLIEMKSIGMNTLVISDVKFMWIPMIAYGLIGTFFCLVINIIKPIKTYEQEGLIRSLIEGFSRSVLIAVLSGLLFGIIGLMAGSPFSTGFMGFFGFLFLTLFLNIIMRTITGILDEFHK